MALPQASEVTRILKPAFERHRLNTQVWIVQQPGCQFQTQPVLIVQRRESGCVLERAGQIANAHFGYHCQFIKAN